MKISILAIAASFACLSAAAAQAPTSHSGHHRKVAAHYRHGHRIRHIARVTYGHVTYLPQGASERGRGYRELVGDPDSGVGFYPLPYRYRIGAWRHHMREASIPPVLRNGVLYAMMMDRYRYNYWWATPVDSWRFGVFDPYGGVGTPYFAGYYGPAGGDDEVSFPFGPAYRHN